MEMKREIAFVLLVCVAVAVAAPRPVTIDPAVTEKHSRVETIEAAIAADTDLQLLLSNDMSAAEIADAVGGTNANKRFVRAMVKTVRFLVREYVEKLYLPNQERWERLNSDWERTEKLTINMATARAIDYYPTWRTLTRAVLLNEEEETTDRITRFG